MATTSQILGLICMVTWLTAAAIAVLVSIALTKSSSFKKSLVLITNLGMWALGLSAGVFLSLLMVYTRC